MKANLTARFSNLTQSFSSGKQILALELDEDFREYADDFKDKDLAVEIKPKVKRRSLNANAFFWATVNDIASVTGEKPTDIYRTFIRDVPDNNTVICVASKKAEAFREQWEGQGLGWICDYFHRPAKDERATNLICYVGSSRYDRSQMSRLVDLALQEAKQQGIPPRLSRAEIQATIERWGEGAMNG